LKVTCIQISGIIIIDIIEPNEGVEDVNIYEESPFNLVMDEKDSKFIKAASLNQLILKMTDTNEEEYGKLGYI
jgi:hypothetical protein